MKSTVDQIRQRFDKDVERFSNLQTGQSAVIDAPLMMELVVRAAAATNPEAASLMDIGCGAGNYTLKLLELLPELGVTLMDLSRPMLERAVERIQPLAKGGLAVLHGDIRELETNEEQFDIILAAMVLHHLRGDEEWQSVFRKLYRALKPGGSLWIADMIDHAGAPVQTLMWQRYGAYLTSLKDDAYRKNVFAYIEQEDTPRSLFYQLDLLRACGFSDLDVLHKNGPFAAFCAVKNAE